LTNDWYFFGFSTTNWVSEKVLESYQNGIITWWGQEVV